MTRRSFGVLCAGMLLVASLPAVAAEARWIEESEGFKLATVLLRAPLPHPAAGFTVQELPLKSGIEAGKPYPLGEKKIFPLLNLDLFQIEEGKHIPVLAKPDDPSGLQIVVIIPDEYARSLSKGNVKTLQGLAFWDDLSNRWVLFDELVKNKDISQPKRTKAGIWFEVYRWPVGDRVIGCW